MAVGELDLLLRCSLASDGYPYLHGTLAESEASSAAAVARDPAGISELWTFGKALKPGYVGHDDRLYVRLLCA